MLEPALNALLAEFRDSPTGRQLLDPENADGRCKPAALALLALLHEHGYGHARLRNYIRPGEQHYVVELDGAIVDPSARQFSESATAEIPTVAPRAAFEADWDPDSLVVSFEDPFALRIHRLPPRMPAWRSLRAGLPARA